MARQKRQGGGKIDGDSGLLIVKIVDEVKDDVRDLKTSVERVEEKQNTMGDDITHLKNSPLYMVDEQIKKRLGQVGGIGGLLLIIIALITM